MKKALVLLGLVTLGGAASAQTLQANLGATFGGLGTGVHVGVSVLDLANLGGLALDGRVSGDFRPNSTSLNVDALLNFPTDVLNLYGGVGVSYNLSSSVLGFGLTGGLNFPVTENIGIYGEGVLRLNAPTSLRAGVTFTF
ncbi:hypothetical protein [Deinococcus yavapaiensis]|uniref:Outer membrane protein with beta-barrel domain n=1 Tax=Deinococcus yavapaiensis KR-236 TaxID=694435 RepID=A0A318SAR1_9DEIO|nr:hypothetical protein [Deinococcus yavapaiensis]PYE56459.1 hypothetical protein DES52_101263 [Deinococcus yavapaiensis KR-236]